MRELGALAGSISLFIQRPAYGRLGFQDKRIPILQDTLDQRRIKLAVAVPGAPRNQLKQHGNQPDRRLGRGIDVLPRIHRIARLGDKPPQLKTF
jgi:hypothetical protein